MAERRAQLIVRKLSPRVVAALRARAAGTGRSMEAEHREILSAALRSGHRREGLKEWLQRFPNVGSEADFRRKSRRARRVRL